MTFSDLIKKLQTEMNSLGERLTVDGDPGPKTKAALEKYDVEIDITGKFFKPVPTGITREMIADKIVSIIQKHVDERLRETNGKNRSPDIDNFNARVGAPKGTPYCASGGWCAIDDACEALGLKNPLKPTAASQDFRRSSYIPAKYLRPANDLAKKGDVGVLQVPGDSSHGHHTTVSEDQKKHPLYESVEYNTDAKSGDRDGDGAYEMTRSTIDKSSLNAGKLFICFADVPQYIYDFNGLGIGA